MRKTPPTRTSPLILRPDGGFAVTFDTFDAGAQMGAPPRRNVKPDGTQYTVIGYRQTLEAAARGGKPNRNYFRFRNEGVRALARSFRGQPFIMGHNWGDPRARGGTIADAWAEQIDAELLVFFDVVATEEWAVQGFESGTIDRFSFGVDPMGEIICTVHEAPIWSADECCCCPGAEVDGMVVEFEYENGTGLELSAVNVPAVDDTYVLAEAARAGDRAGLDAYIGDRIRMMRAIGLRCGRQHPALARVPGLERIAALAGGAPVGGFRASGSPRTMAADDQPTGEAMDPALIRQQLGLPVTATDDEVRARISALGNDAAQAGVLRAQLAQSAAERDAERDAAHVEAGIAALRASHQVTDQVVAGLRAAANPPGGRAAFDAALELVRGSAPAIAAAGAPGAAPAARGTLQSDARPAAAPSDATLEDGPDAFEANRTNPNLPRLMKWAQVTPDQVRQHGSRQFTVVPNLRELADATATRDATRP